MKLDDISLEKEQISVSFNDTHAKPSTPKQAAFSLAFHQTPYGNTQRGNKQRREKKSEPTREGRKETYGVKLSRYKCNNTGRKNRWKLKTRWTETSENNLTRRTWKIVGTEKEDAIGASIFSPF